VAHWHRQIFLPAHIDFINAHGTATENTDEVESKSFGCLIKPPAFIQQIKYRAYIGEAAGAIEAVAVF